MTEPVSAEDKKKLVDRLREWAKLANDIKTPTDAADLIEADGKRLAETSEAAGKATYDLARQLGEAKARAAALAEALRPFAKLAAKFNQHAHEDGWIIHQSFRGTLTLGDLRAALAAQTPTGKEMEPFIKTVERILDEESAWIARPNHEVTRRIAFAAVSAYQAELAANHEPPTTPSPTPGSPSADDTP